MSATTDNPFAGGTYETKKLRRENTVKTMMLGAAILLIVPILVIVGYLFYKASPVLSWDYIWGDPGPLGKSGGIWLPLIGTFYLVIVSLILVAPVGILAGVYLNEYAGKNWLTRIINMAVTSL
ncbi:MAG: hypothetical protein MK172_05790, partial [Verrucomicrobiales bacterium]|nr:hypothetical protein [Verrucomicrobiales bacterium]